MVRSRRSVLPSGQMLVELERTLPAGERIRMRTWYAPLAPEPPPRGSARVVAPGARPPARQRPPPFAREDAAAEAEADEC